MLHIDWKSDPSKDDHYAYLLGIIRDEKLAKGVRELQTHHDEVTEDISLKWLQIECACGWRSPRFRAPEGTIYFSAGPRIGFKDGLSLDQVRKYGAVEFERHVAIDREHASLLPD